MYTNWLTGANHVSKMGHKNSFKTYTKMQFKKPLHIDTNWFSKQSKVTYLKKIIKIKEKSTI